MQVEKLMTRFQTVDTKRVQSLYHWQRYIPERLITTLRERKIWCSRPGAFNDPWDCKPYYSTKLLDDPQEREQYIEWYAEITRRQRPDIPADFIEKTQKQMREDATLLARLTVECSEAMWPAIDQQYRVYCLGPDVQNSLMWANYADSHKGICLEFSTRNEVICCALRVEYSPEFPIMRPYSKDPDEDLVALLSKSDVWGYEKEYRLVAQERNFATQHETLMTQDNYLTLPKGALTSVIVGCQGRFEEVRKLVHVYAPDISVKRAERVPNRYELHFE